MASDKLPIISKILWSLTVEKYVNGFFLPAQLLSLALSCKDDNAIIYENTNSLVFIRALGNFPHERQSQGISTQLSEQEGLV